MGGISKALAGAGAEYGVQIRLNEPVESIRFSKGGTANGVYLESGEIMPADIVVSNATPHETFTRLVPKVECPSGYLRRVESDDYSSGVMKVNAILSGLPKFKALETESNPSHYMKGTIHISPTTGYIERALRQAKRGIPSDRPLIEMTIPSIVDDTLAPPGHHVMSMFVQYTPYHPQDGEWNFERKDRYFREKILGAVRPYVSNIDEVIMGVQLLAPPDLYREFRLTGGNIFHGALSPGQLYCFRHPYRTPVKNLWLCGAGTHPGGGVMGACGHNAAYNIIKSLST
jgi:phytoene dehydrogenase-like protein